MFDEHTVAHLESGCALILATISADNEPRAGRGWGLTLVDDDPPVVRLVLDGADTATAANLAASGAIAITSADVATLESFQLKGHTTWIGAATPDDRQRAARYIDDFLGDIQETDGSPREALDAWAATTFLACTVSIVEAYVQTPGPAAGSALGVFAVPR